MSYFPHRNSLHTDGHQRHRHRHRGLNLSSILKMYHRGYYNQKPNKNFTQAQLFCKPMLDTDVLRLPQSMMKAQGKQISRGRLDASRLTDFRDDLIENWDTLYSHTNYRPCKKFLVVLLTEQATGRFTRSTSMKYPY